MRVSMFTEMPRRLVLALALMVAPALMVAVSTPTAIADDASAAAAFVKKVGDTAVRELTGSNISDAERVHRMHALLDRAFDEEAVGKFVLGVYYRRATPAQFKAFLNLYGTYVAFNYASLFKKYNGQQLVVDRTRPAPDGETVVYGHIEQPNGPPVDIEMRVHKVNGDYKAVDLRIEGVSMLLAHRKQFASVISRQNGIDGLLDALRKADARFQRDLQNG